MHVRAALLSRARQQASFKDAVRRRAPTLPAYTPPRHSRLQVITRICVGRHCAADRDGYPVIQTG
jgi:hypothetical protein